ncbi:hypothetical protein BDV25DRAFT_136844 [Aspergillus avenaceus]|uniref:Tubby C-terminal-like domain-containing protein n=1 Tax=Aspergillus avenaceus TaxID=36643 RepID=A0A5N6U4V5_ASPAV|nr:hypothetical protein BDV25DRAFT_136844 [Aspergillus avenaceus]
MPPRPPPRPLALRPESIAPSTLSLDITNRPEPWHSLNYSVEQDGTTLFRVSGYPFSVGHKRVFYDASGLPLFELRSKWYNSSVVEVRLPGEGEVVLTAKVRVAVSLPKVVVFFRNFIPSSSSTGGKGEKGGKGGKGDDITMEVWDEPDEDIHVLVFQGTKVAVIRRITDPRSLVEGQRPPFRFRPKWEVKVARGVDVAIVAVVVVILGQRVGRDAYDGVEVE